MKNEILERGTPLSRVYKVNADLDAQVESAVRRLNMERALIHGDHTRVPHTITSTGTSTEVSFGD